MILKKVIENDKEIYVPISFEEAVKIHDKTQLVFSSEDEEDEFEEYLDELEEAEEEEEDEEDDDEDYEDDDCDDDRDEAIYVPAPRPKCRAERGKKDESMSLADNPEESCLGCGCLVLFIIGIFIVLQLYS